jgi:hypothetical protein
MLVSQFEGIKMLED